MSRPKKINSFEKFSNRLQVEKPYFVAVQADSRFFTPAWMYIGVGSTSLSASAFFPNHYDHSLIYTVMGEGRSLYKERLFIDRQKGNQESNRAEREKKVTQTLLAGQVRVMQLGIMLPDTEVYLAGPDLKPIPEEELAELSYMAQDPEIEVPQFVI
jgi:hypothetical protein